LNWFIPLGVALTSNLDNLAAGAAIGTQGRRIAVTPNLLIALITALATWCAMSVGASITHAVPESLLSVIGAVALIMIGLVPLVTAFRHTLVPCRAGRLVSALAALSQLPETYALRRHENEVSLAQAGVLGVALSLNNLATGVAAGAVGVSILLTTIEAAALSFLLVALGAGLGSRATLRVSRRLSSVLGSMLLVGVGMAALFAR
jgi:putative sporulation protein YtaF